MLELTIIHKEVHSENNKKIVHKEVKEKSKVSKSHKMVQHVVKRKKLPKEDCKAHEDILLPLRVVVKYAERALKNGQTLDAPILKNIVGYEHNLIVRRMFSNSIFL